MTITSRQNPKLKQVRTLRAPRKRRREGLFVTEGEDLLEAGLGAGHEPHTVLIAARGPVVPGEEAPAGEGWDGVIAAPPGAHTVEVVDPELLDEVSELGSGTRVIAIWEQLEGVPASQLGPVCVALDGVGDPANVGAIIRSSAALVEGGVLIGAGAADPFGPKALRASMGAIFTTPIGHGSLEGAPGPLVGLVAHGGTPLPADPSAELGPGIDPAGPLTLCVGSERDGLSEDLAGRCDALVTIPLPGGGAESLNVAAATAILLQRISTAAAVRKGGN